MSRNTIPKKKIRGLLLMTAAGAMASAAILAPAPANADPNIGCETVFWWTLGSTQRTICDTPRDADGTWMRYREFWTPAHAVPLTTRCSGGAYSTTCTSSGGYWQPQTSKGIESYPVNDGNVVSGEPGWLPAGTDVLR